MVFCCWDVGKRYEDLMMGAALAVFSDFKATAVVQYERGARTKREKMQNGSQSF